ncbi:MAG: cell cycle transcriptional regulator TrcR [Roseibium sp.]
MANTPLMPKATAVWLVDNTALSFTQIASFCKLHPLEVKAIADGEAAQGIKGLDPILTGQLNRDEVEKAQRDPNFVLKLQGSKVVVPESKRKGPRYTPVSRRQDRPNAILWLVRNHPELKDAQVIRLVGTTKPTIAAIRDRTHWNSANLAPSDPVTLGLCSQLELDMEVEKAAKNLPQPVAGEPVETLMPVEDSTSEDAIAAAFSLDTSTAPKREEEEAIDADAVFAKLNSLKNDDTETADEGIDAEATEEVFATEEPAPAEDADETK